MTRRSSRSSFSLRSLRWIGSPASYWMVSVSLLMPSPLFLPSRTAGRTSLVTEKQPKLRRGRPPELGLFSGFCACYHGTRDPHGNEAQRFGCVRPPWASCPAVHPQPLRLPMMTILQAARVVRKTQQALFSAVNQRDGRFSSAKHPGNPPRFACESGRCADHHRPDSHANGGNKKGPLSAWLKGPSKVRREDLTGRCRP